MTERKAVGQKLRREVAGRARRVCEYCRSQEKYSPQSFSVEHIEPTSLGGETSTENLAFSCQGCNSHKAVKTVAVDPLTKETVALFHPRRDRWSAHFAWNADFTKVVGLTQTGRVTVEALRLNRSNVVNLRRALFALNEHPPNEMMETSEE